jgi:hypothetical protein
MPTAVRAAAVEAATVEAATVEAATVADAAKMMEVRRVPKFMVLVGMTGDEDRIATPIATPVRVIGTTAIAITIRRTASAGAKGEQTDEQNR